MIKIENIDWWGFESAIRGMRNPKNSWDKIDSKYEYDEDFHKKVFYLGPIYLKLVTSLIKGGSEHRKFLRQIVVSMDITAPFYWWKEFDTYKVGTVANSCSTMHKIHAKEFTLDDFSHEHLYTEEQNEESLVFLDHLIKGLNFYRKRYLRTNNKEDWWQMIQLLPTSYNQKRTITCNYENLYSICHQRKNHKLDEWHTFIDIMTTQLPYLYYFIFIDNR